MIAVAVVLAVIVFIIVAHLNEIEMLQLWIFDFFYKLYVYNCKFGFGSCRQPPGLCRPQQPQI